MIKVNKSEKWRDQMASRTRVWALETPSFACVLTPVWSTFAQKYEPTFWTFLKSIPITFLCKWTKVMQLTKLKKVTKVKKVCLRKSVAHEKYFLCTRACFHFRVLSVRELSKLFISLQRHICPTLMRYSSQDDRTDQTRSRTRLHKWKHMFASAFARVSRRVLRVWKHLFFRFCQECSLLSVLIISSCSRNSHRRKWL